MNITFESEKKALRRFLALYLISTFFLIAVGLAIFYNYSFHRIIDHQNAVLKFRTSLIVPMLRKLHTSIEPHLLYPKIEGIHTALYDIDKNYLIGDFKPDRVDWHREFWQEDNMLYYRKNLEPYYIGAANIVAAMPLDKTPIIVLRNRIILAFIFAMLFVFFISRWLGKLFLAPVRNTFELLNRFIQDTAHELNTPVSTIVTNVELFKNLYFEFESSEELRRIEIASKRLSRLYDDLVYLQLNHKRRRKIENISFDKLLKERADYFASFAARKNIELKNEIDISVLKEMDREDAIKLIDNLLSNSVKYTRYGGKIWVRLKKGFFEVEDSGIGMDKEALKHVTKRFFRADESVGGFGIGLHIVYEIVNFYGWELDIDSKKEVGTKVRVIWKE